jgi:hypothetical protein
VVDHSLQSPEQQECFEVDDLRERSFQVVVGDGERVGDAAQRGSRGVGVSGLGLEPTE